MRKALLLLFFLSICAFAQNTHYFLGVQNSKYAFAGIENPNRFGFSIKNSLFVEDLEYQYVRAAIFYNFQLPFNIGGRYTLYSGIRYNRDFYDFGGNLHLKWNVFDKLLQIESSFLSYYDSDLGRKICYLVGIQTMFLKEIGVFAGFKNIPEYRDSEQRIYGGLVFDVPRILVKPEISIPINNEWETTTRISISFTYRNTI